jgi:hypothetical protein
MQDYEIDSQTRNFERLTVRSPEPESTDFTETTYEGNRVRTRYDYKGARVTMPSRLQVLRYFKAGVDKLGGEILWESESNYFYASFVRNDKQYYMLMECIGNSDAYARYHS